MMLWLSMHLEKMLWTSKSVSDLFRPWRHSFSAVGFGKALSKEEKFFKYFQDKFRALPETMHKDEVYVGHAHCVWNKNEYFQKGS